jgi:hypothetical protein
MTPQDLITKAAAALRRSGRERADLVAKAAAALRLSPQGRQDLTTKAAGVLRLRRDDFTRIVRVLLVAVVGLAIFAVIVSVPGWGATHALLGIHEAPGASATSTPLTVDQAKNILNRTFAASYLGETTTGSASEAALRTAYTDQGLRGADGRVKLASVQPLAQTSPLLAPHPQLVAISRGFGYPRFIVAQTVTSDGGLPVLHLLVSPDVATPYRISMSVEMVPPATVKPFDVLGSGSPLATSGAGLVVAPASLLNLYAAKMAFPANASGKAPFGADSFSDQVRAGAAAASSAVASQATFTQTHKVVPSSVYAVRQADGGALVFGALVRTDAFAVKAGQNVNTAGNKAFVLLSGKKLVTKAASITTLEFVIFAVPQSAGQATLVAAREQIVAGSGS